MYEVDLPVAARRLGNGMASSSLRDVVDRPATQLVLVVAVAFAVAVGDRFLLGAFLVLAGLLAGLALSGSV